MLFCKQFEYELVNFVTKKIAQAKSVVSPIFKPCVHQLDFLYYDVCQV